MLLVNLLAATSYCLLEHYSPSSTTDLFLSRAVFTDWPHDGGCISVISTQIHLISCHDDELNSGAAGPHRLAECRARDVRQQRAERQGGAQRPRARELEPAWRQAADFF